MTAKMNASLAKSLKTVYATLEEVERYQHASRVLGFDQQTICPPLGMEEQGETSAFLSNKAFQLSKSKKFISAAEDLYAKRKSLNEWDRTLAESLHRDYLRNKNITPAMDKQFSLVFNKAFVNWLKAKKAADFSIFADSLSDVRKVNLKQIALAEKAMRVPYDNLLDVYERGITTKDLTKCFDACNIQ